MVRIRPQGAAGVGTFGTYAMTALCQMKGSENTLRMRIVFDEKVIGASQTQRVLDHFAHVFISIDPNLDAYLSSIQSITPQEMGEVMSYNVNLPKLTNLCVQDLITEFFNTQPEKHAVWAWDGNFTYSELQQYSTKLSHALVNCGLCSTSIVPIYMTKSKWVPVAILGVVKAGKCFTLMDLAYPMERIRAMLEEINSAVVLSNVPVLASDIGQMLIQILPIPELCLVDEIVEKQAAIIPINPSDRLYVAWSSGSTGKPKGGIITHKSFASATSAFKELYGLTSESRVLQFASYAFDMAAVEILSTLMTGGCVCIPSETARLNALATTIEELEINTLHLTPTVARLIRPKDMTSVKTLQLGGEPITQDDIRSWKDHCNLVISYGPSECSGVTAIHQHPQESDENSIGSGVGVVCWIVHPADHNVIMPIGAVGELLLEGHSVGLGYLNDPERTKSTFIDSPKWLLQLRQGQKTPLYKTGDLVQYTSGNRLRYIARKDNQIKLHGQRLELDEVERHMWRTLRDTYPDINDLVGTIIAELVYPQANGGRPTLIAFIRVGFRFSQVEKCKEVPRYLLSPFAQFSEIFQRIKPMLFARVPRYMVPAAFLPVSTLPQTLSGKTDRRQLRSLSSSLSDTVWQSYTRQEIKHSRSPSTENEKILHRLLNEILDVKDFGMEDNFFYLGGDSIMAMSLVSLAREGGYQLRVEDIFKFPVLGDLAETLKVVDEDMCESRPFELLADDELRKEAFKVAQHTLDVSKEEIEDIYPCTPLQEGMVALGLRGDGDHYQKYISHRAFELRSDIDLNRFRAAWEATVKASPILRAIILPSSEGAVQLVLKNPKIFWEEREGTLPEVLHVSLKRGLGLQESLIRFAVIQDIENDKHHFLITVHHSIYDGLSWRLVLNQVEAVYNKTLLSIVPRPFVSFIKYLQTLDSGLNTEFWASQLADIEAPHFPILPSESYRPKPTRKLKQSSCHLRPSSKTGATSATVLQLAWALTLSQYTGSDKILFGLTTSGRDAPINGIQHIVGPTIATFPVYTCLDRRKTVQQLLLNMQAQISRTIPHGQFGLPNIGRVSHHAATACRFQSLLVIQPALDVYSQFFAQEVKGHATSSPAFDVHALTLCCNLNDSGTSVDIEAIYDENVLPQNQITWILQQFVHSVKWLVRNPEGSIDDTAGMSREHLQQLHIWNQSPPQPIRSCIHDLICRHRNTTPTAIAISAWDGELTYKELDIVSSRLASRLSREVKIYPGVFVPVSFEKSKWVMVAVLAVLKAGGAFLLLDTSQPIHRQHTLCQEVSAPLLLASVTRAGPMADMGWRVIPVGDGMEDMDEVEGNDNFPHSTVCSNDPA